MRILINLFKEVDKDLRLIKFLFWSHSTGFVFIQNDFKIFAVVLVYSILPIQIWPHIMLLNLANIYELFKITIKALGAISSFN